MFDCVDDDGLVPPDLLDRQFGVGAPNLLLVADFTDVKLVTGFVLVAFVIDAHAGAIVGWEASGSKHTRLVESALRQAAALRSRQDHPIADAIYHSHTGSHYMSMKFSETQSRSGTGPVRSAITCHLSCFVGTVIRVQVRRRRANAV